VLKYLGVDMGASTGTMLLQCEYDSFSLVMKFV